MESVDVFSSLNLINSNLQGLQARLDWMIKTGKLMLLGKLSKKADQREINETLRTQDLSKLKKEMFTSMETFLDASLLVTLSLEFVSSLERSGFELDMSSSPSISYSVLRLLTNLLVLLSMIRSIKNIKYLPMLYFTLEPDQEEEFKCVELFIEKYKQPVQALTLDLQDARKMLIPCVLSCGKVLYKLEKRPQLLLEEQLEFSCSLRDLETCSTISDTFNTQELARVTFFSFILVDMPWKISVKDDPGFILLEQILGNSLATVLFRNNLSTLHGTLMELTKHKQDREKAKKLAVLKQWQEKAGSSGKLLHKDRRLKLAHVLQEYLYLLEDAPVLLGPKLLMIIIILSQSNSELRWWALHYSYLKLNKESMEPDPEIVTILFYINRYGKVLRKNKDVLVDFSINAIRSVDLDRIRSLLDITEIKEDFKESIDDGLEYLEGLRNGAEVTQDFLANLHSVLSIMAVKLDQSSSVFKKSSELSFLLETIYLHGRIILIGVEETIQGLDLSFLYPVKEDLREVYADTRTLNLPYHIALPTVATNFPNILTRTCPEEFDSVLSESLEHAVLYLEDLADHCITQLDKYFRLELSRQELLQPYNAAAKVHARFKRIKKGKDEEDDIPELGKKDKTTNKKEKHQDSGPEIREQLRQDILDLGEGFQSIGPLKVGPTKLYPQAFLNIRVKELTRSCLVENFKFPNYPKMVKNSFSVLLGCVENCNLGLDAPSLYLHSLQAFRELDEPLLNTYLCKYVQFVVKELRSPNCHFNSLLNRFCVLSNKMEVNESRIEDLTEFSELTSLLEMTGIDGVQSIINQIQICISEELNRIFSLIEKVDAILPQQGIIEPGVQIGKLMKFLELVEESVEHLSRTRSGHLRSCWEVLLATQPKHLQAPPELLLVAATLGVPQTNLRVILENWLESRTHLESDKKLLLDSFNRIIPVLNRLQSSRYFQSSPAGRIGILTHQNNIECLVHAISTILTYLGPVETTSIKNVVFAPLEYLQPSCLSILILVHSFFSTFGGAEQTIPYSLVRFSHCLTGLNYSQPVEAQTLHQELHSKRIVKFIKDFNKLF